MHLVGNSSSARRQRSLLPRYCSHFTMTGAILRTRTELILSSDMFFPPADCQAEWRLIPEAEFRPIQTIDGHLALFGADPNAISQLDKHLSELLATKI